ncbi:MAG: NADP-reducing hydrogenase subunit HndC [Thermotogota bacterium]|nr:NADP-reducing hydrogenase subunit HndC [Thermotogota bacterium]MDK2864035.1 NADP-reducing hydrogenase subunit HndC [Thermotogota bacterium]HCZ06243.1 NADH-quinone oxidoreductase subunit NuoF [Thermotogota bacterium]
MKPVVVLVSVDSNSVLKGAREYKNLLIDLVEEYNLSSVVDVLETGSFGVYLDGVLLEVLPDGIYYLVKSSSDVREIVEEHLLKGRRVFKLEVPPEKVRAGVVEKIEVPQETRVVLRNAGVIDPTNIKEYIARDGYAALAKALTEMKPVDVIEEMKKSGLRGRGGAGFPTGLKWEFTFKVDADQKYVLCNADEGEPGTFKDRLIMEGDPHSVLEGMAIAAYAVGANKGYIYIRGEYYESVRNIRKAIEDAYEYGLLGDNIMGTDFSFHVSVRLGAGAYICGEETALMESIEGKAGRPRLKPPYPPVSGLFGKPTVINNVETFANVAPIILNGADWFRSMGTESSPGTKVFTLVGNVVNRGLVEVPMGTTVRELIYVFGGGVEGGRKLKMVQTGGTAGTFIGTDKLDTPLDYDSFTKYGVSIGSGVILVIDERHCAVDIAKNVLGFFAHESCGKCSPCREGTRVALQTFDRLSKGLAKKEDIEYLWTLADVMQQASLCGLGQSVPVPMKSLLQNFADEMEAHLKKECPTGVCKFVKEKPRRPVLR